MGIANMTFVTQISTAKLPRKATFGQSRAQSRRPPRNIVADRTNPGSLVNYENSFLVGA